MKKKEKYLAPFIEVIGLETENDVMAGSGGGSINKSEWGSTDFSRIKHTGHHGSLANDIEDMINNLLTVEQ